MSANREAAKRRAEEYRKKFGDDYFKNIGKIGGKKRDMQKVIKTNKEKYGDDFYLKLAEIGRNARKNKREQIEYLRGEDASDS